MTAGERLTTDSGPDVRARHVARYDRVVALARGRRGTWWDVACGDGYGTERLPGLVRAGFDKDGDALTHARATVPRANFWQVDVTTPYWWVCEPSRPNVIVCVETLEHLAQEDQAPFIASLAHVLQPHGMLALACPLGDGPSTLNPWHLHEPTENELRALLSEHFLCVHVETGAYVSTSGPAVQAFCACYAD